MPQYRLSIDDSTRFPAGLQDVVTSYCYLTQELGVPASKIVLSGDSAGANLVLAFVKYLAEYGSQVPLDNPRAAWLWLVLSLHVLERVPCILTTNAGVVL